MWWEPCLSYLITIRIEIYDINRKIVLFKAHSHYCVFRMRLWQTVALLRRDRKIPISALTQSTAESADRCGECLLSKNSCQNPYKEPPNSGKFQMIETVKQSFSRESQNYISPNFPMKWNVMFCMRYLHGPISEQISMEH